MTTASDIVPGDVLLFRGKGLVSWAIRLFDGGEVNHAAIALPDGRLAEAAATGLVFAPIQRALDANMFTEIRRRNNLDLTDVVATAERYVENGNAYAYQQIFLLALLGLTRRIPAPRAARRLIRSAMDHAAAALNDLIPLGRTRMICSEFVYRVYSEASTSVPNPFRLEIDLGATFADDDGSLLGWALQQDDRPLTDLVGSSFAEPSPPFDAEAAERELNELVIDYIDRAEAAGEHLDVPSDVVGEVLATFGISEVTAPPEPTDDELLTSMASFGMALEETAPYDADAEVSPTFDLTAAGIATTALMGALHGIVNVSVEPNFVTPRDLAMSTNLTTIGRVP